MAFNTHVAERMWTPEFYTSKTHRRSVKIFLKLGTPFLDGGHFLHGSMLKKKVQRVLLSPVVKINKLYIENKVIYIVFKHISVKYHCILTGTTGPTSN